MIVIGVGKRPCAHTRISTWAVLDDDRLAPSLAKAIADEPRGCIRRRAGANRDDDPYGANRPGFVPIGRRCGGDERTGKNLMDANSAIRSSRLMISLPYCAVL